jgi:hypothetical protein
MDSSYTLILHRKREIYPCPENRTPGWMTRVPFPAEVRDFSILHSVQTGSGSKPCLIFNGYHRPFVRW